MHRGGWRDARAVLQALFAELAVYLNRAGGWAAQAPTTDLRTPPPTSRSPTRTKQPICRCNNIPRHFLRPTMIEFALLFTCFRKLGPGFRKLSAGPVVFVLRGGVGISDPALFAAPIAQLHSRIACVFRRIFISTFPSSHHVAASTGWSLATPLAEQGTGRTRRAVGGAQIQDIHGACTLARASPGV